MTRKGNIPGIELQENPAQFPIKSSLRVTFVQRNPWCTPIYLKLISMPCPRVLSKLMIYARVLPRDIFRAVFSFPYFAAPSTALLELKSNSRAKYAPRWLLIIKIARVCLNSFGSLHCRAFSDGTHINWTERHDERDVLLNRVSRQACRRGDVFARPGIARGKSVPNSIVN